MVYLAKAYDSGIGLGTSRSVSWVEAVHWYTEAIEAVEGSDEEGNYDGTMDNPTYQLLGRLAEMYRDGGHGIQSDPSKAGKNRLVFLLLKNIIELVFWNSQLICSQERRTQPWLLWRED